MPETKTPEPTTSVSELSALNRRLTTEYAVSRLLAEGGEPVATIHRALAVMGRELGWDYCLCWQVIEAGPGTQRQMRAQASWMRHPPRCEALEQRARAAVIVPGQGLIGAAWAEGRSKWSNDVVHEGRFLAREEARQAGLGSGVCCPISVRGQVIGMLQFLAAAGVSPDRDSLPVLESAAGQIGQFFELAAMAATLRASEARLRLLFDANIAGVHCSTLAGVTVAVNAAMVRMFRFPSLQTAMEYPAEALYFDPQDRADLIEQLRRSGKDVNRQLRLRRYDGKEIWVLANTVLIPAANGQPDMNESTVIDITESKEVEQRHRQTSKLEGIGRLAGGVAHDFNNLLTVINGYSDLLLGQMDETDGKRASVLRIRQAGQRAEGLTRQLLAVSRKQASSPVEMDLTIAVDEAQGMLATPLGPAIQLKISSEPGLGTIRADPGHITQIIMNLALNARDAMPNGGQLLLELHNVEVDEDYTRRHVQGRAGRYVRLMVSDTGTGMDAETRQHAFEPFFTTKPRGKGTGLGLATVYGLVLQSGGWIEFYSEPGHGTTFKLYFPRVEKEGAPAVAVRAEAAFAVARGETVLICDDAGDIRDLIQEILTGAGYRVTAVASAAEALVRSGEGIAPDLLISDLILPDQTGVGLVRQLAETRPNLRVVLTSGFPVKAAVNQGLLPPGAHGWEYLQKPFAPADLLQRVRSALDGQRKRAQGV